jgi:hypothetical protein
VSIPRNSTSEPSVNLPSLVLAAEFPLRVMDAETHTTVIANDLSPDTA